VLVGGLFLNGRALLQGQPAPAPAIPRELTSYRDVVKRVLPAVVSVEAKRQAAQPKEGPSRRRVPFGEQQLPPEFRRFFPDFEPQQFEFPDDGTRLGFGS